MKNQAVRIVLPALVLALFFSVLSLRPNTAAELQQEILSSEKSARLLASVSSHLDAGEWESALEDASQLRLAYPGNYRYVRHQAHALHGLQRYAKEATAWELFFQIAPRPIGACPDLGLAYQLAGQRERGIEALERCLELSRDNVDSILFLALA